MENSYETTDINFSAYLSMCGVEPLNVECRANGIHVFNYDPEEIAIHREAYESGALVPAKQYADARQRMKTMRKAGRRQRRVYQTVRWLQHSRPRI